MKRLIVLFALCLSTVAFGQKFKGLALTPPMGWNTWNTFGSNISEKLIEQTADAMAADGMLAAGYKYIIIDDTWMAKKRDADGNLVADPLKFPHGMKAVADYLHAKGFKFGIYEDAGTQTCGGYPGSRGHEYQDARLFAKWGVDYLKYDWCDHGTADAMETYKTMRDALYAAGRPIVFSMCEWGSNKPWKWAADIGDLWRTTGDITDCYDCQTGWSRGWKVILDAEAPLAKYAGPGHWNDPDMLEVGNSGLTMAESRAHFSFWCMLAAPLIAGNDVRSMTKGVREILENREVIAVDQDKLGHQGIRFYKDPNKEIWIKQLSHGDWAVCMLNASGHAAPLTIDWDRMNFYLKNKRYALRDLWKHEAVGNTEKPFTATVASHDVVMLRLSPMKQ